jgi:hypothetical protein
MSEKPASGNGRQGPELAEATTWIGRIMGWIGPGLLGLWVDYRFGTKYWAIVGFVLGLTTGILQLVQDSRREFGTGNRRPTGVPPEQRDKL